MLRSQRWWVAPALVLVANAALADFHTFKIEEVYSNKSGTVQYIVMHESQGANGENLWAGHTLTVTHAGATKTFMFSNNLPGSATAGSRVLIATQGFAVKALVSPSYGEPPPPDSSPPTPTPAGVVTPDYLIPNGFLATDGGVINYAGVDQMPYASLPTDGVNALYRSGTISPNLATDFVGRSASVTGTVANYEGLWWNAPASSESGWGINLAHQGDVIFATWFTYDLTGKEWWLSMTASKQLDGSFAGTLIQTTGPAFDAMPFNPAQVIATPVGTAALTFNDLNNGTFAYTVNGLSQTKPITRQVFGPLPTCIFAAQSNLALATNYQDLWWAAPAGFESGWGINFTQQGDTIFATWFTYDRDHTPLWLSVTAPKMAAGVYAGTLFRTTGPAFTAVPFDPTKVVLTAVGQVTLTFSDGNTGTFAYTVNGVTQTKSITRQVFRTPGTVCQ